MGKKSAKRKTRWRVLPIGTEEGGSGSGNDDDDLGTYSRATQKRPARTHSGTNNGNGNGNGGGNGGGGNGGGSYYNNKQYYHPRSYNHEHSQPLVTTEKQIFNEEEYTKITTPRQDVLFKKGYLGRKRPVVVPDPEATAATDAAVVDNAEDMPEGEGNEGFDEQPQYIYTNGFMDHTGVYYINGSGYEMYDPYTGQVAVLVGPHYGHPGGPPPLLAAVSCQPVPLQPLEWFNPAAFLPYVQATCHGPNAGTNALRDRRKRYSTDSQNCSPVSSESTGPPGSPQESDEMGGPLLPRGPDPAATCPTNQPPMVFPHPPPTYVYPGYMFGAPMYNVNGVTVQTTPNQAPSSDVTGKRRKKKRKRRRKLNGEVDASEESSSEGGGDEKDGPHSLTCSQESSLESDSKHSLSSEDRVGNYPVVEPVAIVESVTKLNPRATDFTCNPRKDVPANVVPALANGNENDTRSVNGNGNEHEVQTVHEVNYAKTNGSVEGSDFALKSDVSDKYSAVHNGFDSNGKVDAKTNDEALDVKSGNRVANRPKLDFAAVVSPKLNGHVKQPEVVSPPAVLDSVNDDSFERYEDFSHLNGFTNGEVEEEWITVKPKPRKSENAVTHNGHPEKKELTNGHGKPFKDYRQTNGSTRGYKQQETRLYKTDVKYNGNGKIEDKFVVKKPVDGYVKDNKQNGKVKVNGKMEGNEKEDKGKERKTSSSSSEGKMETPPVKPTRRERKNKSISPPKTPETMLTSTARPFVVENLDSLVVEEKAIEAQVSTNHSQPPSVVDVIVKEVQQSSSCLEKLPVQEITVSTANVPEVSKNFETPRVETIEKIVSPVRIEKLTVESSPPVEKKTLPKVPSLKDLSTKTIVQEASSVNKTQPKEIAVVAKTPDLSNTHEEVTETVTSSPSHNASQNDITKEASHTFLVGETSTSPNPQLTKTPVTVEVSPVDELTTSSQDFISHEAQTKNDSDEDLLVAPVPPPRRKKYRPLNQRLPERAPTPGKASDSDSSSSLESEASVIECLNSALDRSDQSGLSSSDEEVIYSGKLGVEQPKLLGKMKVPRSTWTSKSVTTEVEKPTKSTVVVEELPLDTVEVTKLAEEIVDSVIDEAVKETTRLKRPNLGITDAVTRWLRSQSPDVLSVSSQQDEMGDILEETEDELDGERDEEDGSKNWERNPLAVPSVNGSVDYRRDGTDKRVANKITDEYLNTDNGRVAAIENEINGDIGDDVGVPKVNGRNGSGSTESTDTKDKVKEHEDLNELGRKETSVLVEEVTVPTETCVQSTDESVRAENNRQTAETDETKRVFHETVSETDENDKDELEWDTWDLTLNADRKPEAKYDPLANDTFQAVDGRQLETPTCESPLEMCPKLYDANLSVAKYYNLAKTSSPAEEFSDSETDDLLRVDNNAKPDGYRVSLATELARLQQPLPPTWKVAPLVVKTPLLEVDSGVESGDDVGVATTIAKKPSVFKRKLVGRLKGEGGPFPCGGVCCIVQ